jgi:AraC-like DNA-binding protein
VAIDEPMQVSIGSMSLTATAALIPPDIPHSFAVNGRVAFLWADPHGPRGRRLKQQAMRYIGRDIGPHLHGIGEIGANGGMSTALARRLLVAIGEEIDVSPQPSRHVSAAVAYLEAAITPDGAAGRRPRLDEAARVAAVSPSRLTHLFTEEMGIPFRRYVLWLRLMLAVQAIAAGMT